MNQNPYKYTGPLDPIQDKRVCVPRSESINKVLVGIMRGDYWAVLGANQIGKTTFLRLIQQKFKEAHYIYFDFEVPHSNDESFYQWMMETMLNEIPSEEMEIETKDWTDVTPELRFFHFLAKFKPKGKERIILLFDEIDGLPSLRNFLHIWRKVYIERYHKKELERYTIIITGSVNLIKQTIGPNSPFNVAEVFYMKDFSVEESRALIEEPFKHLEIEIEKKAKEQLLTNISGHPQMLQQVCHRLVEKAKASGRIVKEKDVENAINDLFVTSSTLDTLRQEIKTNSVLEYLIRDVLNGAERPYHPYKEFSTSGAGPIIDRDRFCAIRNKVYEKFLENILEAWPKKNSKEYGPRDSRATKTKKEDANFDVLLLYNHNDVQQVEKIGKDLRREGLNPWLDKWNMLPGNMLTEEINKISADINSVIVFVGDKALTEWDDVEIRALIRKLSKKKIPVIPVILPKVKHVPQLFPFLEELVPVDLREDGNNALSKLVRTISGKYRDAHV